MASVWKWVRRIVGWTGVFLVLALGGLIANGRMSDDFEVTPLSLDDDSRIVVLLFHGSNDGGRAIWQDMAARFADLIGRAPDIAVVNYNWSSGSDNMQRAGSNGAVYAKALGQELAALENLEHVRLVAHSAGAYILDALCQSYRNAAAQDAHIEMTFLDPFGNRDIVDVNRGNRHYGACADYAAAYINTDDPVPSTNSLLRNAYNFDVTNASGRGGADVTGHDWPVHYFFTVLDEALARPGRRTHQDAPRGEVVMVN